MAIMSARGTLVDFITDSNVDGNFYGKTGTLRGVRSLSGFLSTPIGERYISIISNNALDPNPKIAELLNIVDEHDKCE